MPQQDESTYSTLEQLFPADADRLVNTIVGERRESELLKHLEETNTGGPDEPYWAVSFTSEYCLRDCDGEAHRTGLPDAREGCFCGNHVHRSVHVEVRKFPDMVPEIQQMS